MDIDNDLKGVCVRNKCNQNENENYAKLFVLKAFKSDHFNNGLAQYDHSENFTYFE